MRSQARGRRAPFLCGFGRHYSPHRRDKRDGWGPRISTRTRKLTAGSDGARVQALTAQIVLVQSEAAGVQVQANSRGW